MSWDVFSSHKAFQAAPVVAKKSSSNPIVTRVGSRETLFRRDDVFFRSVHRSIEGRRHAADEEHGRWRKCLRGETHQRRCKASGTNENDSMFFLSFLQAENQEKIEYRVWNPFRSKLGAAILSGVDSIHMPPGTKVLYLGAASGTTVSHVSDIVGPVSVTRRTFDETIFIFFAFRKDSFTQWNFLIDLVEIF